MIILGLNAYHGDASACLLRDGVLVAAAEEERFRRVKHWAGFPAEAIRYCLRQAGAGLGDVAQVAVNQDARANLWRKLGFVATRRPDLSLILERIRNKREREGVAEKLARELGAPFRGEVQYVEHHLAHLASAYLVSPFDEAVAASVDGFGDFASAAWGAGRGGVVEVEDRVYFPHSLGIFYQALTQFLGFPHYGDEYKVMGLAPYGEPAFLPQMRRIVRLREGGVFELDLAYFRHATEKVDYEWDGGAPVVGTLYSPALVALLGPARGPAEELTQRHRDLARSVQAMYEEAFFHLLSHLHARYKLDALCLAGGCAMNSVANGKVYARSPFRRLYVQAAAGDAGGAIGAALVAWQRVRGGAGAARSPMTHAYYGPEFSDAEIGAAIDGRKGEIESQHCSVARVADENLLIQKAAEAIAGGAVVGWFQGRMEWGPRALGNRSILCDPRRADMKHLLNAKIKRRESFRPFAPSILREAVPAWFETDDDVPFMMQVYPIRQEKRALIPAVTHVDGSGRLQTVTRESNPRYHALIGRFAALTGVPMVLNTSFNENEPVVCRPDEALDCFLRTKMDVLVMGDWFIAR
ncbi:MAG TPA: carbamoyltransferase C-terminal domain-containing protein [Burkholderiales bacterium]|nr:carbamoyltransferase C-terminal domain-containing protein [Burkholderiales bacterium]